MADQKYLDSFKKNVEVVADRLRALKYFSFREIVEDEELRDIQSEKKREAEKHVLITELKSKMNFSLEICSDFELEFIRRKMIGWIKIYNNINPIIFDKTIKREEECLKEIEEEILKRKNSHNLNYTKNDIN